jgi:hypothetical protein
LCVEKVRPGYLLAGFLGVSPGREGIFGVKRDASSGVRNYVANPADYLIAGTAWSSQSAADFL